MTTLTTYRAQVLTIVRTVLASRLTFAWIRPSWVMATIEVESSFQPLAVNTAGRLDGLMQVIPTTVTQVQQAYSLGALLPQTDPHTSITCGSCVLDWTARKLIADWTAAGDLQPGEGIPVSAVIEGYNEGEAAAEKGIMVPKYWGDWDAAASVFSVDGVDGSALAIKVIPHG